jgi:hypothetical protein
MFEDRDYATEYIEPQHCKAVVLDKVLVLAVMFVAF